MRKNLSAKDVDVTEQSTRPSTGWSASSNPNPEPPKSKWPGRLWDLLKTVAMAVIIALLITNFVIQKNEVIGSSMHPTLETGDIIWVEKLSRWWDGIQRGDIVTVSGKAINYYKHEDLIKRVVGMPGESIKIENGLVYINGVELSEPYLQEGVKTELIGAKPVDLTLGVNEYFVMGDNRSGSSDSRYFGPVQKNAIIGELLLRSRPFSKFGFVD